MADNNFKVFDESNTNVMSDTDYANHTQRSNGVQSGVASSALHNKLYRQVSMMSKALADFIVSQAFDAKDEDSQLLSQNLQKALNKFAKVPLDTHNTNPAAHAAGIAGNAATATADQQGVQFTQGYVGGRTYLNAGMFHAWNEIMTAGVYTIDESCFDLQGAPSNMVTSGVLVVFLMQDTVAQLYIANRYNSVTNDTALKSMATRLYINNAWTPWRYAADYSGIAQKFLMLSGGTLTGDLTVPTVHGELDGNADSATRLQTARQIILTGDVNGTGTFDGSKALEIVTTLAKESGVIDGDVSNPGAWWVKFGGEIPLIIQGIYKYVDSTEKQYVTFPIEFPNACLTVTNTIMYDGSSGQGNYDTVYRVTKAGMNYRGDNRSGVYLLMIGM